MALMKKYIDLARDDGKWLEISVNYQLGGYSCITGRNNPRGYYVLLDLVERSDGCISRILFGGDTVKLMLFPVNRQSEKNEVRAVAYVQANLEKFVELYKVMDKNGLYELARAINPTTSEAAA